MNISELFDTDKSKPELGYDLKDDVMFFMDNDPEFYRKKYFPMMLKFDKCYKEGKNIHPRAFRKLVDHAYEIYRDKFPVDGLPEKLEEDMCEDMCKAIHEKEINNCKNKFYDLES